MDDIFAYDKLIYLLRQFFRAGRDFVEVPVQSRKSILAACEDPETISQYVFGGVNWPLPQTGQMWLEYELLQHSDFPGVFCISTSYRNEPFPIPGRHDKIFPMFEFEAGGGLYSLLALEKDLLEYLGFGAPQRKQYEHLCDKYGVEALMPEHEEMIRADYGDCVSVELFPQRSHPFWNMKRNGDGLYNKVDVILCGMETIGSAERSCNVEEMREGFNSVSDGKYAELLFHEFGRGRVLEELEAYLALPMFPRFGGGIGLTRLARAMKLTGRL